MEQYVKSGEYASTMGDDYIESINVTPPEERAAAITKMMSIFLTDLRERKATRDLLRWEIGTGKSMLSDARNQIATRLVDKIGQLPNYPDTNALIAFLTAGIYYTAIATDYREKILDVDLHSDEGWKRIENVIESIIVNIS
jgi:hypothetical protein